MLTRIDERQRSGDLPGREIGAFVDSDESRIETELLLFDDGDAASTESMHDLLPSIAHSGSSGHEITAR